MSKVIHPPLARRRFLHQAALGLAGAAILPTRWVRAAASTAASEKLSIGVIGVGGQGGFSIGQLKDIANITALCDVDDKALAGVAAKFPGAKTCNDFRQLLDAKDLDAVVVATPDHTHAVAAVAALKSGRHLYCEKPLARTISETRIITTTARETQRVTQIGTQIHAGTNYRRVVELVQGGAIGDVREVHVWVNSSYGGKPRPTTTPPVPPGLHWDLWLGPVPEVPYHPDYAPFHWRNWWSFGGGSLADFGCHFMDLPFWALRLQHPRTVEAEGPAPHPDSTPTWLIVRYEFPERAHDATRLPPVKLTWYHGGKYPADLVPPDLYAKWKGGVLFVGAKGQLLSDYGRHVLLPERDFEGFVRPSPSIPDSIGHHQEWIEAIRKGGATTCPFSYAGPLTEAALLGNVAFRTGSRLEWDFKEMQATNQREADRFIRHQYRKGWAI